MEIKNKKVHIIPIDDILKAFGIEADKKKDCIYYSSIKDELRIEVDEVNEK